MDEYERASDELAQLILQLTDAEFEAVRDRQTPDEECRSIQTVINHVVRAGYGYAHYMRVAFSLPSPRIVVPLGTRSEIVEQLAAMLAYTVETLDGRWEMPDAEMEAVKIQSRWGTVYDLEQMLRACDRSHPAPPAADRTFSLHPPCEPHHTQPVENLTDSGLPLGEDLRSQAFHLRGGDHGEGRIRLAAGQERAGFGGRAAVRACLSLWVNCPLTRVRTSTL